jgi:hypothetical protein
MVLGRETGGRHQVFEEQPEGGATSLSPGGYGFRTFRVLELALYHSLANCPNPNPRFLLTSLFYCQLISG